jgi:hypothetical protein
MFLIKKISKIEIPDFVSAVITGLWFWWLTDVFELTKLVWIRNISETVWAAIVASVITLSGVIITVRSGNKQRDKDRNLELRREIYLNATAAITQWQGLIGKLSNLEFPQSQLDDELNKISPILSKVTVVANNDTIKATSRLTAKLLSTYLNLLSERMHLMDRKIEIDITNNDVQQCLAKQQHNLQIMEHVNLENDVFKQNTYCTAKGNFDFWTKRLEDKFHERDQLQEKQMEEHLVFTKRLCDELRNLGDYATPALFAIRRELEIPIDEQDYKQTLEEISQSSGQSLDSFLNDIKNKSSSTIK